ncbi:Uncharacterized protein TCM_008278 [Theobroma cacao]|uniref:Uncharacterized protein n=1 Tax=Theobroma cacao TaxID=3641 RepID=A0A061E4M5_THECC|nr:Uncharacterized protein TCM_008278 [Theobroma cacao]
MLPLLANRHTIVLTQTSQNRAPRTFVDYDSISQAMDNMLFVYCCLYYLCFCCCSYYDFISQAMNRGICGPYEMKLKKLNPATQNITYDIGVLYNFIDGLADMIALVYDSLSLPQPFSVKRDT